MIAISAPGIFKNHPSLGLMTNINKPGLLESLSTMNLVLINIRIIFSSFEV